MVDKIKDELKTNNVNRLKQLSIITSNQLPIFNKRYNIYDITLRKSISKYSFDKFIKNKNRYIAFTVLAVISTIMIKIIKYYYVGYYYFMYDVDIRKPKVSDYFLQRYR